VSFFIALTVLSPWEPAAGRVAFIRPLCGCEIWTIAGFLGLKCFARRRSDLCLQSGQKLGSPGVPEEVSIAADSI
jgi:hypothetical protein